MINGDLLKINDCICFALKNNLTVRKEDTAQRAKGLHFVVGPEFDREQTSFLNQSLVELPMGYSPLSSVRLS
jgi:hypothetical protein